MSLGVRWQAERDTAFARLGDGTLTKAPSPLRVAGAVQNALLFALLLLLRYPAHPQDLTNNKSTVRFRTVDISLDSKVKPLAAYQIEFSATAGEVKIVGIEGGEHAAFTQPPFHDPKAMQHDHAIIAAFSTDAADKLPKGKTRVATIHVQIKGAVEPKFEIKLQAAADAGGNKIAAEASVEERKTK